MLYNFCFTFILFIIYSFIGYLVEVFNVSLINKKLVLSRGYLIGPYLPIFGVGAISMCFLLERYSSDILILFIMSMVICTVIEYFTSLIMEKLFKLRWWDYSNKKFNIDGRVCLENGVMFGLGGILIVKIVNPFLTDIIYFLPSILTIIIGIILLVIFIADFIESTYVTCNLKVNINKYLNKDATSVVRKELMSALEKNALLTSRLFKAFPNLAKLNEKELFDIHKAIDNIRAEIKNKKTKNKLRREKV